MENNYHKKLATKKLLIFMLPLLFVGCMHMPAFRDYMADMSDDVFSDIVKASYTGYIYYEDPYVGRNTQGDVNMSNVSNPAIQMNFNFQIDANRNIRDLTLELTDATKYKPIMK